MTITAAPPAPLTRPQAVLRIMDALRQDSSPPRRLLLEGIAYLAQRPEYDESDCRVIAALRTDASQDWLLELHESLAYLQSINQISWAEGRFRLTPRGEECVDPLRKARGVDEELEVKRIRDLAGIVRTGFGI